MTKKKETVETKPGILSRIDSVIADIQKQSSDEVSKLREVRKVETAKAVFTFEEIEEIYRSRVSNCRNRDHMYDHYSIEDGMRALFETIKDAAETKV